MLTNMNPIFILFITTDRECIVIIKYYSIDSRVESFMVKGFSASYEVPTEMNQFVIDVSNI